MRAGGRKGLLLGKRDYVALEARGKGKVVGWNVTVRSPGRDGYPVDENEKFFIDGEQTASIEFQGLEDSFGFSWGFPESQSMFPLTGYFPFLKGAAAYRFFIQDAISFEKSLRVAIGFGVNEDPMFRREFSKPGQHAAVVHHRLLVSGGAARAVAGDAGGGGARARPGGAVLARQGKAAVGGRTQEPRREAGDAVRASGQGSDLRRDRLRGRGEERLRLERLGAADLLRPRRE